MDDQTFQILDVRIAATSLQKTSETIARWIREGKKTYVCMAPVSTIVDCQRDPEYRRVVNEAGMTTPDGMPLVWFGRSRHFDVERTYGPDLMQLLCENGQATGRRHYFFGGTDESNRQLVQALKERYPSMIVAGTYAPAMRAVNELEKQDVIDQINAASADILWVGLGSPKQDFWMSNHRARLDAPVFVGVGAAFDFLSGNKKQAPLWVQRNGLEWLFRLGCEPRRLWKRYLIGNSRFLFYLARDAFSQGRRVS